jgi:hypothetical protein
MKANFIDALAIVMGYEMVIKGSVFGDSAEYEIIKVSVDEN